MKEAKKKFSLLYMLVFIIATIAITEFFTAYKFISTGDTLRATTVISLSLLTFALCLCYMAYRIYADEKGRDNLRVKFAPFEYVYEKLEK